MGTKQKIEKYIEQWESRCYSNGIPDEAPSELESNNLVPSYRKICIALMKNDTNLKYLGFTPNKSRYYSDIKQNELLLRGKIKQLKLKL